MLSFEGRMLWWGVECYHVGSMLSGGGQMLSCGINVIKMGVECYHVWLMLSCGVKFYHVGWNVIMWKLDRLGFYHFYASKKAWNVQIFTLTRSDLFRIPSNFSGIEFNRAKKFRIIADQKHICAKIDIYICTTHMWVALPSALKTVYSKDLSPPLNVTALRPKSQTRQLSAWS